jgi:PII-like signaling protein
MQTCGRDIASVVADLRRVVYEQVKLQPGMSRSYSAVIIAGLCRHALSRRRRLPSIDCTGLMLLEGFGIFTFEKCSFPEEMNMKGFLVIFFTQQNRRYQGKMLGEWIVDVAKEMGLRGATLSTGIEGFGHTGRLHSSHFFELADQPTEIRMAITEDESERLFKRLEGEEISVFFIKTPIEMGTVGKKAN